MTSDSKAGSWQPLPDDVAKTIKISLEGQKIATLALFNDNIGCEKEVAAIDEALAWLQSMRKGGE